MTVSCGTPIEPPQFDRGAFADVGGLDQLGALAGALRFEGRYFVRWNQADIEAVLCVEHLRFRPRGGFLEDAFGLPRGHRRPVGPNDLQAQIGAGGLDVGARRLGLGDRRPLEGVRCVPTCKSATETTRAT